MGPWWEQWPGRREAELESFRRHGLAFVEDETEATRGRLVLHGSVEVGGEHVDLTVVYPDSYPWTRFAVRAPGLDLDRHQHPFGKNLCVFPRSSEFWRRTSLAGDVVAEDVPRLLQLVRAGGARLREAEDPQGEPFSDFYSYAATGAVLVPEELLVAAAGLDGGQFTMRAQRDMTWLEAEFVGHADPDAPALGSALMTTLSRGQTQLADAPDELRRAFTGTAWSGEWVRLDSPPRFDGGELLAAVVEKYPHLARLPMRQGEAVSHLLVGLVFQEEVRQGEWEDGWVFVVAVRRGKDRRTLSKAPPTDDAPVGVVLLRGLRSGKAHVAERVPELQALQQRCVSVIGLGTLGAPFTRALAQGLIRELRLADHDFVDPATAPRWSGALSRAGQSKPYALAAELREQAPYTRVVSMANTYGAAATGDDRGDHAFNDEWTQESDLLVDATAEDNVTAALAQVAWNEGKTFLTLWSFEGHGGVVARIVPGETGCYLCLERRLSPINGTMATPAKPTAPRRVQPRGCADPTFTAPAADLQPLVDHATRVAYGELCRGVDGGYPRYDDDVHILSLRTADGRLENPPRWETHPLAPHPDCPCHGS